MGCLIAQYFLNHRLDPKELEWQVEEIARQGYHGLYAHARQGLRTPYFSEEWWQALETILQACRRLGLEFWIWDEDYFPSGLAGGRVVWSDAGLAVRQLEFTVAWVEGPHPVELDFAPGLLLRAFALEERPDGTFGEMIDVTRFCGTRRQNWESRRILHRAYSPQIDRIGHPHWRTSMADNRFALVWTPPRPVPYLISAAVVQNLPTSHPDLLRPEGIRRFLELTHEEYARRFPEGFGQPIRGAFTDEPSPGAWLFPWTAHFPEEFRADHGYDLLDYLPHLATDIDARSPLVRHHYRQTQHRLLRQNYLEPIGRWCAEHRIAFAGHLTRTEWLSLVSVWWPNELRCYEALDIPCCDPLGASEGWPDAAAYHTGIKVASSAAHLFGKTYAGSDCLAVIGDEASLRDLKYHFDYQMVLGINHFSVHGLSYSLDGPRKDEVPPSLFYQHSQWPYTKALLDYVGRTAEELTGGRHLCELAVLYPSTSLACQARPGREWTRLEEEARIHETVEHLLSHQRDFDFIDEVALQQADEQGRLPTPEPYRVILLPWLRYIDAATAEGLLRFAQGGGRVIALGSRPQALGPKPDSPQWDWADASIEFFPQLTEEVLASLPGVPVTGEGARDVFVLRREKGGEERLFVFNRREEWFGGSVAGQEVTVPPRGSLLLKASVPECGAVLPPPPPEALDLSAGWEVEFPANHVPLSFWHVVCPSPPPSPSFRHGEGYDLMRREADPAGPGDQAVSYFCRFMLTGAIPDARLVFEDSTVTGEWTVSVNGMPVEEWRRARVYDCRNLEAPVGPLLRGGSNPTLNVVRIDASGPGRGLHEVPYLYGSFTGEYRYGHLSFPFLRGPAGPRRLDLLLPWDVLGYPTFSGTAVYRRRFRTAEAGDYLLDLGRVEDCAAVSVDGRPAEVLAWPPYRCLLQGLSPGEHELRVEVANPPANRNRAAGRPAGLLGPVRLWRQG